MALARKVRELWDRGCDIQIGYTVIGVDVGRVLRSPAGRGPVPMKHLVQDFDGDGEFDNYFHLKAMSIVGNVGGDRSGYVVLNGSANWSGLARGERREPRHLLEQAAHAAVPGAHRLLVRRTSRARRRSTSRTRRRASDADDRSPDRTTWSSAPARTPCSRTARRTP